MIYKKKRLLIIVSVMVICVLFSACRKDSPDIDTNDITETPTMRPTKEPVVDVYDEIMSAERITLEEAYEKLSSATYLSERGNELYKITESLKNCSGRFVQQSEYSKDRYIADVSFYFVAGEIYCSIEYTNYMGIISDDVVVPSNQSGYLFESFPKGDLFGQEQDFTIYFGNEMLYIAWADVCEYTLTRADGSVDAAQEYTETFEESGLLDSVISLIDKVYGDLEYQIIYNEDELLLSVYIQGPDSLRTYLNMKNQEILDSWKKLVETTIEIDYMLYDTLNSCGYVDHVHMYWVDYLKVTNNYDIDEILLWVDNGVVKLNCCSTYR